MMEKFKMNDDLELNNIVSYYDPKSDYYPKMSKKILDKIDNFYKTFTKDTIKNNYTFDPNFPDPGKIFDTEKDWVRILEDMRMEEDRKHGTPVVIPVTMGPLMHKLMKQNSAGFTSACNDFNNAVKARASLPGQELRVVNIPTMDGSKCVKFGGLFLNLKGPNSELNVKIYLFDKTGIIDPTIFVNGEFGLNGTMKKHAKTGELLSLKFSRLFVTGPKNNETTIVSV
jgi:hypothetical protein